MIGRLFAILPLVLAAAPVQDVFHAELHPMPVDRLVPGNGWTADTLPQVLPGAHADAVCIGHWTRVPDQILWRQDDDRFRVGVLAYHRSDVDHVRFAVDGGPWLEVRDMLVSSQTDHYEYSAVLLPGDFARGWHEVRAVVVPESGPGRGGTERVLRWRFWASQGEQPGTDFEVRWVDPVGGSNSTGDGSNAAPFRTLKRALDSVAAQPEGARIYLQSDGSNPIPVGGQTVVIQNQRPITIRRAPGHFPILGPNSGATVDRLQVENLRFEELRIDFSFDDLIDRGAVSGEGRVTLCNCEIQGYSDPAGQAQVNHTFTPVGADEPIWILGGRARDFRGMLRFQWGRAFEVSDARTQVSVGALIDSEVRDTESSFEPSLFVRADENGLVDSVKVLRGATAVGPLGGGAVDGTAIVNSIFEGSLGNQFYEVVGLFSNPHRHLLLLHCSFPSAFLQVNSGGGGGFPTTYDMEHGLVYGIVTEFITDEGSSGYINNTPSSPSGLDLDASTLHTHHPRPAWSGWTNESESATYVDVAGGDYRVRASSAAAGRIPANGGYVRFDLEARRRGQRTALGALKAVGE